MGMHRLLLHWLLNTISLLIVTKILPGIQVTGFPGLILKIVLLPFIVLTLGLLYFLINGLMLKLASELVPGFRVEGCFTAVAGSVLLSVINFVLDRVVGL